MCSRAVGTGAAGPAAAGPMFSEPTPIKNNGAIYAHWTHSQPAYGLEMRLRTAHAHMDVTTFNMTGTHFPAEQFLPTKAFSFPRRQFGSKGDQRSFHAERCDTLSWLHYTMSMRTLFSATLVCAARLY